MTTDDPAPGAVVPRASLARASTARDDRFARARERYASRAVYFFPRFPSSVVSLSRASRVASRVSRRRRARRLTTRRDATGRSVERKPTTTNADDDATNERTNERDETVYFSVVRRRVVASRVSRRRQRPPLEPLETLADGWSRRVCSFIRDDARARERGRVRERERECAVGNISRVRSRTRDGGRRRRARDGGRA